MFEGGESMPLIGEEKTTLADVPDVSVVQSGKYSFIYLWRKTLHGV